LSWLQLVVLAVVQGITEFLPISSSAHLILVPRLAGWPDQGVAIDAASHLGTLAAVLIYFWRDVRQLVVGFLRLVSGRRDRDGRPDRWGLMAVYIVIGTVPLLIVGYAIDRYTGGGIRSLTVIAWTMPIFGIVLYLADRFGATLRRLENLRFSHAITIGCAQALALIPGISRSGITMVSARLLGFERAEAARFSFLLSIPAILGAGILKLDDLSGATETPLQLAAGTVAAAVSGFLAVSFLIRLLRTHTLWPFIWYRLAAGALFVLLLTTVRS
jgi:undecaprenyl-diphosphatase